MLWLTGRFPWMGQHSGYEQLCEAISRQRYGNDTSVRVQYRKPLPMGTRRFNRYLTSKTGFSPFYNIYSAAGELRTVRSIFLRRPSILHITYVEEDLGLVAKWRRHLSTLVLGTAHQPASWWRLMHPWPECVASLDALIVLGSKEVSYFEKYLPGRVHFIPHGVDADFFRPNPKTRNISRHVDHPRCVFGGRWLRDVDTMAEVIQAVIIRNPNIRFDMIVPRAVRGKSSFFQIARHDQVSWYAGVSDEQLRNIYQQGSVLLLPLIDCVANNTLLEAMACGLPVVSNDVGALRDYTHDSFAELFPVGDIAGMTHAILRLADDYHEIEKRGSAARLFVEQNLAWDRIAARTFDLYSSLTGT